MASRIDMIPDPLGNRCYGMYSDSSQWFEVIRYWVYNPDMIEPIIAKGNIFDGILAVY